MKKIFALVIAIALTLALAVPALADGEDAAVFGTELNLVANDPTVEYDEWDVPYNVWNVIPAGTKGLKSPTHPPKNWAKHDAPKPHKLMKCEKGTWHSYVPFSHFGAGRRGTSPPHKKPSFIVKVCGAL